MHGNMNVTNRLMLLGKYRLSSVRIIRITVIHCELNVNGVGRKAAGTFSWHYDLKCYFYCVIKNYIFCLKLKGLT